MNQSILVWFEGDAEYERLKHWALAQGYALSFKEWYLRGEGDTYFLVYPNGTFNTYNFDPSRGDDCKEFTYEEFAQLFLGDDSITDSEGTLDIADVIVHEGTALQKVEDIYSATITEKLVAFGESLEEELERIKVKILEGKCAGALSGIDKVIHEYAYLDD